MLRLVFADRHDVWGVEENVGRHERRVVEQSGAGTFLVLFFTHVVLVLGHLLEFGDFSERVHDPAEFSMLADIGLAEDDAFFRIKAASQIGFNDIEATLAQFGGRLMHGDGVVIRQEDKTVIRVLQRNPLREGADIVAEMEIARGLNAGDEKGFVDWFHIEVVYVKRPENSNI